MIARKHFETLAWDCRDKPELVLHIASYKILAVSNNCQCSQSFLHLLGIQELYNKPHLTQMLTAVVKNSYPIRAATETTKITRDALKYNLDSNDKKTKQKSQMSKMKQMIWEPLNTYNLQILWSPTLSTPRKGHGHLLMFQAWKP